ncbi:MAG: hypothetical protein WCK98_05215 [bacterium]
MQEKKALDTPLISHQDAMNEQETYLRPKLAINVVLAMAEAVVVSAQDNPNIIHELKAMDGIHNIHEAILRLNEQGLISYIEVEGQSEHIKVIRPRDLARQICDDKDLIDQLVGRNMCQCAGCIDDRNPKERIAIGGLGPFLDELEKHKLARSVFISWVLLYPEKGQLIEALKANGNVLFTLNPHTGCGAIKAHLQNLKETGKLSSRTEITEKLQDDTAYDIAEELRGIFLEDFLEIKEEMSRMSEEDARKKYGDFFDIDLDELNFPIEMQKDFAPANEHVSVAVVFGIQEHSVEAVVKGIPTKVFISKPSEGHLNAKAFNTIFDSTMIVSGLVASDRVSQQGNLVESIIWGDHSVLTKVESGKLDKEHPYKIKKFFAIKSDGSLIRAVKLIEGFLERELVLSQAENRDPRATEIIIFDLRGEPIYEPNVGTDLRSQLEALRMQNIDHPPTVAQSLENSLTALPVTDAYHTS